jgi:hypothetical protein
VLQDLGAFKKNTGSIPRTITNLSHISHINHVDTALALVKDHKKAGSIFINLTSDHGLSLYSGIPKPFKGTFIEVFKKRPKIILGLTKTHLLIHTIKAGKKHHLVGLIIPIILLALLENLLPIYVLWALFIGSSGYSLFLMKRRKKRNRKTKRKEKKPC